MKINYRPEIDGLRAIAVSAVIVYHSKITLYGFRLFEGGFLGVDIFFVISGYLITSIILKELVTTNKFSFKNFYERRIRRILPALLFVILVSLPLAWIILFPSSLIDFANSIIYSLGFSSNLYFYFTGQQYGAIDSFYKPFLHTWSLSIEEQYYILFPLFFFLVFKYFKKNLIYILITIFTLSLIFSTWLNFSNPSLNFYFISSRIWELLAGSILAYFEAKSENRIKNNKISLALPSLGFFLILFSILFFNHELDHPSINTLPVIIGTCLIISFSQKGEIITKILSSKLFVGLGLISYSLYLWHYPILVFLITTGFTEISIFKKVLIGLALLLLSLFSFYFIEKPFRNSKIRFNFLLNLILILFFILIILNILIITNKGFENRFFINDQYKLDSQDYKEENLNFEVNYNYNNFDNRKNVLIVGNSHAEDLLEIFSQSDLSKQIYFNLTSPKKRKKDYNYQIYYFYKFLTEKKAIIDFFSDDFIKHLNYQYDKSDLIILSSNYTQVDLEILNELIKILKKDNKKVLLFDSAIQQTTKLRLNRLDYFVFKNKQLPKKKELEKIEQEVFNDLENTILTNILIKDIAQRNNIQLIERDNIFCEKKIKRCPVLTNEGYKIYWDNAHITKKGAEFFAKKIESSEFFIEILKKYLNTKN